MVLSDEILIGRSAHSKCIDLKDRALIVFGAGVAGKTLIDRLALNNIIPDFIIDESKNFTSINSIQVINPVTSQIDWKIKDSARVIIAIIPECSSAGYHYADLIKKTVNWGFKNIYKIDFYSFQIAPIQRDGEEGSWYFFDSAMNEILGRNRKIMIEALSEKKELINDIYNKFEDGNSKNIFTSGIKFYCQGNQALKAESVPAHQYFIPEVFDIGKINYAVDAGAYTGDTLFRMMSICPNLKRVYCFEPSIREYSMLLESRYQGTFEIFSLMAGLGEKTGIGNFVQDIHRYHKDADYTDSPNVTPIIALDEFLHGSSIDFIKMDIEGAEKNALLGARNTIKQCQPLLAICVYHNPEDLWEIPEIIQSFGVSYRYYLRRHSMFSWNETVFYAVPERLAKKGD
jgi:FkbM family methyltransferase